jgi:hypothetical protein
MANANDDNDREDETNPVSATKQELEATQERLVTKAYAVRDMPDGAEKQAAKTTLINAAKKVEAAQEAVDNVEELNDKEKELVKEAYTVRDMPSGPAKEARRRN